MRIKRKGVLVFIICIAIYSLSGTDALNNAVNLIYPDSEFWNTYLNLIFYGVFLILFEIVYRKDLPVMSKDFISNIRSNISLILKTLAFIIISAIISTNLCNIFGISQSSNQNAIDNAMVNNMFIATIVTVLIAPIVEEMLFRFHFFGLLAGKDKKRKKTAYIISSLCFALYHTTLISIFSFDYMEIISVMPIFFVGLGLAYLQDKTSNIICPITAHVAYNLLATVMSLL